MMTQQIPDPMPHEMVGEIGYELWVWAARWAPKWLNSQLDPEAMFKRLNTQLMDTNDAQVEQMLAAHNDREMYPRVWDQNLARLVRELKLPAPEASTPVWDGHSDGIDLDAPPEFPMA